MKNIIILFSIIPTVAFGQNIIIIQAANPQANAQLINYENNVGNLNVNTNNDWQYIQLNNKENNDYNPIQQQDNQLRGGGINLPKLSLPTIGWKPTAVGGRNKKEHKMAKTIFKGKKKLRKVFGKTKKIRAAALCCKW